MFHYALQVQPATATSPALFLGYDNDAVVIGEARFFKNGFFTTEGEWKAIVWNEKDETIRVLDDEVPMPEASYEDADYDEGEDYSSEGCEPSDESSEEEWD